jgi:hypothetical protein
MCLGEWRRCGSERGGIGRFGLRSMSFPERLWKVGNMMRRVLCCEDGDKQGGLLLSIEDIYERRRVARRRTLTRCLRPIHGRYLDRHCVVAFSKRTKFSRTNTYTTRRSYAPARDTSQPRTPIGRFIAYQLNSW